MSKALGERVRSSQDLDHWASFQSSFAALTGLIQRGASGEKGDPPSSITILSSDVHHGYLAEASLGDTDVRSRIYQAVCSPLRNALPGKKSSLQNVAWMKPFTLATYLLSRLASAKPPASTGA